MRNVLNGKWFDVKNETEHYNLVNYGDINKENGWQARVAKGKFNGPGRYFLIQYTVPCPRGCCYDEINELLSESDAKYEIAKEIERGQQKLADLKESLK